jgi:hypothetical protein
LLLSIIACFCYMGEKHYGRIGPAALYGILRTLDEPEKRYHFAKKGWGGYIRSFNGMVYYEFTKRVMMLNRLTISMLTGNNTMGMLAGVMNGASR